MATDYSVFNIKTRKALYASTSAFTLTCLAVPASAQQQAPIPDVSVTASSPMTAIQAEGSVAAGYKVDTTLTVGPFGSLPLQDAPYSITVVPRELIENLQATNGADALRVNPFVDVQQPNARGGVAGYSIRGFMIDNGFKDIDGISAFYNNENIEDKERIEVLQGASGFLYGFADNPGGTLNYVLKRPTALAYESATAGIIENGTAYAHGDFGGPIDKEGRFGYRLNIVGQGGSTEVNNQNLQRSLISAAFDWHATEHLLFQLDGSYSTFHDNGMTPAWGTSSDFALPPAVNPNKLWGGEPWSYSKENQGRVAGRMTWDINDIFTVRAAAQMLDVQQSDLFVNNSLNPDNTYSQLLISRSPEEILNLGGYTFLDAKFDAGPVHNKATVGYYVHGYETTDTSPIAFGFQPDTFSYDAATFTAPPAPLNTLTSKTLTVQTEDQNLIFSDQLRITDSLILLGGVNHARIIENDFAIPGGALNSSYDQGAWTPSGSIVFKPTSNITTYFTYQQGLEEGTTVPATNNALPVTNANQVLAPGIDTQYELGAKLAFGRTLLTIALFDLKKTATIFSANGTSSYTASENGLEEHKGIEISLTGKVTDDWTVFGGFTALNARFRQQTDPTLNGTLPPDTPELLGKLYTEYALNYIPGLVLTGGFTYVGEQSANDGSIFRYPASLVGDVGARYTTTFEGHKLTFRASVKNIANTAYWTSSQFIGQPRTFSLSAQLVF